MVKQEYLGSNDIEQVANDLNLYAVNSINKIERNLMRKLEIE